MSPLPRPGGECDHACRRSTSRRHDRFGAARLVLRKRSARLHGRLPSQTWSLLRLRLPALPLRAPAHRGHYGRPRMNTYRDEDEDWDDEDHSQLAEAALGRRDGSGLLGDRHLAGVRRVLGPRGEPPYGWGAVGWPDAHYGHGGSPTGRNSMPQPNLAATHPLDSAIQWW
jgi:hypothetical protein